MCVFLILPFTQTSWKYTLFFPFPNEGTSSLDDDDDGREGEEGNVKYLNVLYTMASCCLSADG